MHHLYYIHSSLIDSKTPSPSFLLASIKRTTTRPTIAHLSRRGPQRVEPSAKPLRCARGHAFARPSRAGRLVEAARHFTVHGTTERFHLVFLEIGRGGGGGEIEWINMNVCSGKMKRVLRSRGGGKNKSGSYAL